MAVWRLNLDYCALTDGLAGVRITQYPLIGKFAGHDDVAICTRAAFGALVGHHVRIERIHSVPFVTLIHRRIAQNAEPVIWISFESALGDIAHVPVSRFCYPLPPTSQARRKKRLCFCAARDIKGHVHIPTTDQGVQSPVHWARLAIPHHRRRLLGLRQTAKRDYPTSPKEGKSTLHFAFEPFWIRS